MNKNVREKNNPFVNFWNRIVEKGFHWTFKNKRITLITTVSVIVLTFFSARFLGTEFLPQLNEGALWVEAKFPMSQSLPETVKQTALLRKELQKFPEVNGVLSQVGRYGKQYNNIYLYLYANSGPVRIDNNDSANDNA